MNRKYIYLILTLLLVSFGLYSYTTSNAMTSTSNNTSIDQMYFNKWQGKSWITLGDSITRPNSYQNQLKDILGFATITNMGENGQTMSIQENPDKSTYLSAKSIDYTKYDLVTIFIGTNDFKSDKKLGSVKPSGSKDFEDDTFAGAYQLLIETILESNPDINIVLITPLQRVRDGYDIYFTNKSGDKLEDYVSVINTLGKNYSLPVLDLYSQSGITKENINTFTRDGLHPNDKGYKRISEKMYRFLLNI